VAADWTAVECEAVVADYFDMLALELRGERFDKTSHRRALAKRLDGRRSEGSIERKHQNISAILIQLGQPWISGYKPLANYQRLLREVVESSLERRQDLQRTIKRAVEDPAKLPTTDLKEVDPPSRRERADRTSERQPPRAPRIVNYLEREARNASLGRAGEELVLTFERTRLSRAGKDSLAEKVVHVALHGDGDGYDIRSYETNGADRFIEVKTTAYGKETPFFVSRNEVAVSRELADQYHLYRVFKLRDDPGLFRVRGSLVESFALTPELFRARVA
jgi:hypothetical protein